MIDQSTISGSYTIIEKEDEAAEAKGNNDSKVSLPLDIKKVPIFTSPIIPEKNSNNNVSDIKSSGNLNCDRRYYYLFLLKKRFLVFAKPRENQICVLRAVFTGLIILICLLSTIQIFSFVNCIYNRYQKSNTFYDENRSLSSTASLTHSGKRPEISQHMKFILQGLETFIQLTSIK